MLIKDLIAKLKEYPQDMIVVVDGWEMGYDEIIPHIIPISVSEYTTVTGGKYHYEQNGMRTLVLSRNEKLPSYVEGE